MPHLPNDIARCDGYYCPSKSNCRRHPGIKITGDNPVPYAAFWARRDPGDSACRQYLPVRIISTFQAGENAETRPERP